MAVFSRFGAVLEPDGSQMSVGSALQRIIEILDRVLNDQEETSIRSAALESPGTASTATESASSGTLTTLLTDATQASPA